MSRRTSIPQLLLAHLRRLNADEEGASMLFAAITFLALTFSIMFVYQIGMVSTDRMLMQNAADAGAYSGALVEANSLNTIAQINDGMAYLHYTILRYVVDVTVVETLRMYKSHDRFVRQRPVTERFWPNGSGDASIILSLSDPAGLRPDDSYGIGAENKPAPDWVMHGDENEWARRTQHVQRFPQLIRDGEAWLRDLERAQRLIVAVTPRLVRDKAAEIARGNGATHVAVSGDLERSFKITGVVGAADTNLGFEPMKASNGDGLAQNMWQRYGLRKMEELTRSGQRIHREFPLWFDATTGRSRSTGPGYPPRRWEGYYQIRLCWNKNDWAHRETAESHSPPLGAPAVQVQQSNAPNGHWHCRHAHIVQTAASPQRVSHGGVSMGRELMTTSGGFGGGHMQDDVEIHGLATDGLAQQHHAFVRCPTCAGTRPAAPGSRWTDVQKTVSDAGNKPGMRLTITNSFPRPLLPRSPLMRSGVTVVAWRKGHAIGKVFPESPWGMLAVATAQVGLLDSQGRVRLLTSLSQDGKSASYQGATVPLVDPSHAAAFFYSSDANQAYGMRFGARLVPIAGQVPGPGTTAPLSPWHPSLADGGLDAMIGPQPRRWYDVNARANAPAGPPAGMGVAHDGDPLTDPEDATAGNNWAKLSGFLRVRTQADLQRALWH